MKIAIIFISLLIPVISLSASEKITLAVSEWPPYEFTEKEQQKGTDLEIIQAAFKEIGIDVEINFYPWKRCEYIAQNNDVDAVFSLSKTPEREKYLIYSSKPISKSENVIFHVNGKKHRFDSYDDLKGLRIGVSTGYTYGQEFDNYSKNKFFETDPASNEEQNFKKLESGRTDLFICDKNVGLYILKKLGMSSKISYLPKTVSSLDMYIGFTKKKENIKLSGKFNNAFNIIIKNGVYQKIIDKYTK